MYSGIPPVQSYYEVNAYPGILFSLGSVCSTPLGKLKKNPLGRCDVVLVNEVFQVEINAILKLLSIEKGLKRYRSRTCYHQISTMWLLQFVQNSNLNTFSKRQQSMDIMRK